MAGRLSVALLLAAQLCAASQAVGQRKMLGTALQDSDSCSLSALVGEVPDVSTIVAIIEAFGLLPDGIPADSTIFLPSNEAAKQLPSALGLPFTVSTIIDASDALGPQLKQKLVSLIAYHISPEGALTAEELRQQRDVTTALNGTAILATEGLFGSMVLTDTSGGQAQIVAGPAPGVLAACNAAVYVLDSALMPSQSLTELPRTTVAAAQGMLGVGDDPAAV